MLGCHIKKDEVAPGLARPGSRRLALGGSEGGWWARFDVLGLGGGKRKVLGLRDVIEQTLQNHDDRLISQKASFEERYV